MPIESRNKSSVRILIIDDDKDICEIFQEILERNDYPNVESVYSGKEAFEKIKDNGYDIAFIDLRLPDINGLDLITKLRTVSPETEFIIVTGYGSLDSAVKALRSEVGGYLEKPISSDRLIRTLNDVYLKLSLKRTNKKFLQELEDANKEIRFLNDLLVNKVDDLNRSLLLTLDQVTEFNPSDEQMKVLTLFQDTIRRNARLTRNIKKLLEINVSTTKNLEEVQVEDYINKAFNRLRRDYRERTIVVNGDHTKQCSIKADKNLFFFFLELFEIAVLNDPKQQVKIDISTDKVQLKGKPYCQITYEGFFAHLIYDQRNIKEYTNLNTSSFDPKFQDLGPFLINQFLDFYNGFIRLPENDNQNKLNFYFPLIEH
jgi:YesN/AraC family two-component response regulator